MDEPLNIHKTKATQLDAWPVVSSLLFDLTATSDDVVSIVDRAGLSADWNLTSKEAYSQSTRKRAYRPRGQTAYSSWPPEDRDTVLTNIAGELARRHPEQLQNIKAALSRIGWTLKVAQDAAQQTKDSRLIMKRDKQLQRLLLLLQVRDGKEPPELANFSEQQQVHNGALLIKDGYVEGQTIENSSGVCVTTAMTELTSKGHDFLDQPEDPKRTSQESTTPDLASSSSDSSEVEPQPGGTSKLIFISHSNFDKDLADVLVDMLCAALHLRRSDFLCTSVEGAKLRGGDQTDTVLRRAIREVPAFLSLLTPKAVASTYVLFELGARWGNEKHHIPLLAKGAGSGEIKDPLKATNALQLSEDTDVLQLVGDLAHLIHCEPEPPNSYLKKVQKVVEISRASVKSINSATPTLDGDTDVQSGPALSREASELLIAASKDFNGRIRLINQFPNLEIFANKRNFVKIGEPRSRACWEAALSELTDAGLVDRGKPFCRVTAEGFKAADRLGAK